MTYRVEDASEGIKNLFEDGSVEAQVYHQITRVQSPLSAAALAARVDGDSAAVRERLRLFTSLGIVIERAGQPPTYERNDAYFTRDEATVLAAECSIEELEADMHDLIDQIWTYQRRYDADTPVGVDISAADITETELADWEAARAEHRCYERAR